MNLLPSTMALLLCLLVATLLGAGIGACLWHLRLARRHARALRSLRRSGTREREALAAVLAQEREASALKHEQQGRRLRQERERAERAVARGDALAAREGEQARRIEKLEADGAALGRRSIAPRARRVGIDPDLPSSRRHHSLDEERLPVLRRRVGGATDTLDGDVLALDGDLEIPMLAESDLPDSVDDLVLELLDVGGPVGERDER